MPTLAVCLVWLCVQQHSMCYKTAHAQTGWSNRPISCHCLGSRASHGLTEQARRSDVKLKEQASQEAGNTCCRAWLAVPHLITKCAPLRALINDVCLSNQAAFLWALPQHPGVRAINALTQGVRAVNAPPQGVRFMQRHDVVLSYPAAHALIVNSQRLG